MIHFLIGLIAGLLFAVLVMLVARDPNAGR